MEPGGGWKVPSGPLPALFLAGVGRWARTADYLSVTLTLLLGAAGAVDVLVMSQRERATDLAILRATGWTAGELARLNLYEDLGLALLGSLTGAATGLATALALGEGVLSGHLLPVAG